MLSKTLTSKPDVHKPETVTGVFVNVWPLVGVEIVGAVAGGALPIEPVKPIESLCGLSGGGAAAEAVGTYRLLKSTAKLAIIKHSRRK